MIRRLIPRLRSFAHRSDGAMLVEAALVLPILLVFMGVIIESGRIAWIYQSAAGGVRDASRHIARTASSDPCPPANVAALKDTATTIINQTFYASINGNQARITNVEVSPRQVAGAYRGGAACVVEVRATVEITYIWGGVFGLVGEPLRSVTAQVVDQSRIYGV